jgi:hypothetical protein
MGEMSAEDLAATAVVKVMPKGHLGHRLPKGFRYRPRQGPRGLRCAPLMVMDIRVEMLATKPRRHRGGPFSTIERSKSPISSISSLLRTTATSSCAEPAARLHHPARRCGRALGTRHVRGRRAQAMMGSGRKPGAEAR